MSSRSSKSSREEQQQQQLVLHVRSFGPLELPVLRVSILSSLLEMLKLVGS